MSLSLKPGTHTEFPLCNNTHVNNRFPPGVLNTVPSLGSVGGAALASHLDVDKVAFTGSTITGRKIMEAAAKSNLKKVKINVFVMQMRKLRF